MKPNLWLLVNPNIACPIQYGESAADVQTLCEPAEEVQTALNPAETKHQPSTELMFASHDASLQEEVLHSTEYMVQYTSSVMFCHPNLPVCGGML